MLPGVDSAFGPTIAQRVAAYITGVRWWGLYRAGPGAFHNWTDAEVEILRAPDDLGFPPIAPLPIYVPELTPAGLIASRNPQADAEAFVASCEAVGIAGAGALDTEESMRADPYTAVYEAAFGLELFVLGFEPVTYAGGFTLERPPRHAPWWIISGTPPAGTAFQTGQATIAGLSVDTDVAGDGFPLAAFAPTPAPPAPIQEEPSMWGFIDSTGQAHVFERRPSDGHFVEWVSNHPDAAHVWTAYDHTLDGLGATAP